MSKDNILDNIRLRLVVIGIPRHLIEKMSQTIYLWFNNNGPEWTVQRLKAMKTFFLNRAAGVRVPCPWVRFNRRGYPSGVFGALMRWSLEPRSEVRISKAIQALMSYSLFTSTELTEKQFSKFIKGVQSDPYFDSPIGDLVKLGNFPRSLLGRLSIPRGGNSLIDYRGSPSKKAPSISGSVHQDSKVVEEYQLFRYPSVRNLASRFPTLFAPVVEGICGTINGLSDLPNDHLYGGDVHFLQEAGFKLRAIASPFRLFQLALKPLGDSIYSTVSQLPWDCTFDQSKALIPIQRWLSSGKTIHSIDLTGATDYFPLEVQVYMLQNLFGDVPDIPLFEEISRSRWRSKRGDIQWQRGQPLGLYPSFGAFTLTHGLLLAFLGGTENFFIVGDDVVIANDELANKYTSLLDKWKCPWSPDKSLTSKSICEFAGKVITEKSVIPQYKWRKMSDDNFLDVLRNLGPRAESLLTIRQKAVYDAVKQLLPPLGCNHSVPGSDLRTAWLLTERFLDRIGQKRERSMVDLNRHLHSFVYDSDHTYEFQNDVLRSKSDALIARARNVFQQSVFSHWYDLSQVADIPQVLSLSEMLPHEKYFGGYRSTLERYERLLEQT